MRRVVPLIAVLALAAPMLAKAQAPATTDPLAYSQPVIVFTHIELVDGTGRPAQRDMTVIEVGGKITAVGPSATTPTPTDATVIDGEGKTLLPGFVLMHEHMFYPTGKANYTEMLYSFPRLYLAGGVTTMRTAGSMNPYADLNLRDQIDAGKAVGPQIDVTGPYLNGPGLPILKVHALKDAAEAVRMVDYWSDVGATSFKGYMHLTRAELKAIDETAHKRGRKVTAHLCSITYHEAIDAGIDNLEHGFFVATDFVKDKQPDVCPSRDAVVKSLADLDPDGPAAKALIKDLIDHHVALTSTLTVFETSVPGRPEADERTRSVLVPQLRTLYETQWTKVQAIKDSPQLVMFPKLMKMEKQFVDAGGTLLAGTDPTGYGGVVPGFASKREVELLVEAGFSFEQAVKIATLNGAKFEGMDKDRGTVEVGKRADLILIDGDPLKDPRALEHMPLVFKEGKGYRTDVIIDQMKDTVGLY
jgi:enamidase